MVQEGGDPFMFFWEGGFSLKSETLRDPPSLAFSSSLLFRFNLIF